MAETRSIQIVIRVTPSENETIMEGARLADRTRSDFGRLAMTKEAERLITHCSNNSED